MFRKLLLASVASLGLVSALALPATAEAHEYRHEHRHVRHGRHVRVYYRDPCGPDWVFAGSFPDHRAAERFAVQFHGRGFSVSIR